MEECYFLEGNSEMKEGVEKKTGTFKIEEDELALEMLSVSWW